MESTVTPVLPPLVSAMWLSSQLDRADLVVLDTSWYLPTAGRDPDAEFRRGHIPGAMRFDLEAASDAQSALPHMAPTAERFAMLCERLGVSRTDRVICYDTSGVNLSAARAWWLFRLFGHPQVAVLDGGFAAWARETRPLQLGPGRRLPTGYQGASVDGRLVQEMAAIERIVAGSDDAMIVDARSGERFRGESPEPRPGVSPGNIPGSVSLPFTELTDSTTGCMLPPAQLVTHFRRIGVDLTRPMVASCGSGVTACVLALAVEVIRASGAAVGPPVAVYDGSWAEWGARS